MCGIFGVVVSRKEDMVPKKARLWSDTLITLSDSRGKEASGIALRTPGGIQVYKRPIRGIKLIRTPEYKSLFQNIPNSVSYLSFIGHCRLATNGSTANAGNNQPVYGHGGLVIHNGIVVNNAELWAEMLKAKPKTEVDSEVIPALIDFHHRKGNSFPKSVAMTYSLIRGAASIAYFSDTHPFLILATNTGSLYYSGFEKKFAFASEDYILKTFLKKRFPSQKSPIRHLSPGRGVVVSLINGSFNEFSFAAPLNQEKKEASKPVIVKSVQATRVLPEEMFHGFSNNVSELKKHTFNYEKILKLQRCTRCLLPETMPFIKFDNRGACNYCLNHKKILYQGKNNLLREVRKYRKGNGKPDCIIALSGGRDSSYGLHYVKTVLGLNPIAYTYDWGMCTDVARRNQYKMTGDLGVEHVIVSGDIVKKREHIRKNILAWIKKPDLGMVPLFMEGDKQNEYYINRLAKRTGINLIIYCRGNELENEEFKWGYCGIKNATPGGVIHNLSGLGKLQLGTYWASRYLTNPAYINSSIFDTLFGFFSTYVQKHDYLYLWHYIPWSEDKIVSTLKDTYAWEVNPETRATWRIDDGTPAFYNYIYLAMQGFTENDTFRSNQIREGVISRKKALALVEEENKPRYKSLKWYFDAVNLDGDIVLSAIDKVAQFS